MKLLYNTRLKEKLSEALAAVVPVMVLVLFLCFTVAPVDSGIMVQFLAGALLLIIGMMFFSLGAELSMTPMGEKAGTSMARSRSLIPIILFGFLLGFIVTISEPDLQVLAGQVPSLPDMTLIIAVATGVGIFLVFALLRMVFGIPLSPMLVVLYVILFVLAAFVPEDFLAVAFDSGGVTTGPMTVPFIMALGVGISSLRNDRHAANDSFGLVALCSIGPVIAVMLLGILYKPDGASYAAVGYSVVYDSVAVRVLFASSIPQYAKEMASSMLPIVLFFAIFHIVSAHLEKKALLRIIVGLVYTYVGLVLFLTGANVGFMPAGTILGETLAGMDIKWVIVPAGMVLGFFIVRAEPAVYVLMKQVEEITEGAIPGSAMKMSLSIGVAVSVGLAMMRVLTGVPVLYFLIPGYAVALLLSFFVPKIFTAIAFDSGGVASGPMATAFLLPFAVGACQAAGGNPVRDAFGVVAMVAMTPLVTIQALGLIYRIKSIIEARVHVAVYRAAGLESYGDFDIIEL